MKRTKKMISSHCCDTISIPFRDEKREKTLFYKVFPLNRIIYEIVSQGYYNIFFNIFQVWMLFFKK